MSTRLGTVPGWERAAGWTSDNRIYEGIGPTIDMFPEYAGEEMAKYWIKFDILFYFCESPPISPVVFRTLKDCMIVQTFISPLKEPIPTPENWEKNITETMMADLADDVHRMSVVEMGGLRKCGISKEENYAITITDKEFVVVPIIPVPVPTPIEVSRAITMIKSLEESAERLPFAREDLLRRANELRERYNLVGKKL